VVWTGKRPLEQYETIERAAMKPLPDAAYEPVIWKQATVHRDSHIAFDKRLYSVPWRWLGKSVWARATPRTVDVYADDTRVAVHSRRGDKRSTNEAHLPEGRRDLRHRTREYWNAIEIVPTITSERTSSHASNGRARSAISCATMRHSASVLAAWVWVGCGASSPPAAPATSPPDESPARGEVPAFVIATAERTVIVPVDPAGDLVEAEGLWLVDETEEPARVVFFGEDPWDTPVCGCACVAECAGPRVVDPATGALAPSGCTTIRFTTLAWRCRTRPL